MNKHELEKEVEWLQICNQEMQVLIDILWEYISEKDIEKITKRLEEHENTMEQTQTRV
jgi:tetrahydromethanopterin S-methyltransferase subunit G